MKIQKLHLLLVVTLIVQIPFMMRAFVKNKNADLVYHETTYLKDLKSVLLHVSLKLQPRRGIQLAGS
jgi:hypothetical protein